jgi:hypothetical protein
MIYPDTHLESGAVGYFMQPRSEICSIADRSHLPRQDEKRELERVLGISLIVENLAADSQNHRPVTLKQYSEGVIGVDFIARQKLVNNIVIGEILIVPLGDIPHEDSHLDPGLWRITATLERNRSPSRSAVKKTSRIPRENSSSSRQMRSRDPGDNSLVGCILAKECRAVDSWLRIIRFSRAPFKGRGAGSML